MRSFVHILFSLLLFINATAQDITALLHEADRLEALPDEKAAFTQFKAVLKINPRNMHALTKSSELCSRIGKRQTEQTARDEYYKAAKTYAEIALIVDPNDAEANCVMAIALGRYSMSKSGKEKIISAKEIKKHVDVAIKSDPNNFKAWHVLGRWHYEISNLNFIERTAVKVFYGGLPAASIKESIIAFEKANSLSAGFILNYLEVAKAYIKNKEKEKAIAAIKKMLLLPNQTEDDPAIKAEGQKLLNSL